MAMANVRRPVNQPAAAKPLAAEPGGKTVAGLEVEVAEKPLTPGQCRKHLRKTVAAAYRDIVKGFVDQAKSGSCQHLKMATEVVEPVRRVKVGPRVKGSAELLIEKMDREFPD